MIDILAFLLLLPVPIGLAVGWLAISGSLTYRQSDLLGVGVAVLGVASMVGAFFLINVSSDNYERKQEEKFVQLCEEAHGVRSAVDPDVCLIPGGSLAKEDVS